MVRKLRRAWHRWVLLKLIEEWDRGPVVGSCEHGNEMFDSIKGGEVE
jgi:hypothetical protein